MMAGFPSSRPTWCLVKPILTLLTGKNPTHKLHAFCINAVIRSVYADRLSHSRWHESRLTVEIKH